MKNKSKDSDWFTIKPLKDHRIVQNEIDIEIKDGVEVKIPSRFKQTLISENVIKMGGQ